MWNVQNETDNSNNTGNWNHLKIIQKMSEQRTGNFDVKELQKTAILGTAQIFYFGKCWCKSTKYLLLETILPVPYTVTREWLQHFVPWKYRPFQFFRYIIVNNRRKCNKSNNEL
jgi:hypothetical protein